MGLLENTDLDIQGYIDQNEKASNSLVLDLETLNSKYKTLLQRYNQAVLDYIDNLKVESAKPCSKYKSTSTGIDQKCYEDIWAKAGCTTTGKVDATSDSSKQKTMKQLIDDSFLWATMQDDEHRLKCYGVTQSPYIILGVGKDGKLYSKKWLGSNWTKVNDNSSGLFSVTIGKDGKTIYCINGQGKVCSKATWDAATWSAPINTGVNFVTSFGKNKQNMEYGLGLDNKIWTKATSSKPWSYTDGLKSVLCYDNSVLMPNNTIINKLSNYTDLIKDNLNALVTQIKSPKTIINFVVAPDDTLIGLGIDNKLYSAPNYKSISKSVNWSGPYNDSTNVTWITIVTNTNYTSSVKYSTATAANYNINATPFVQIQGQAFWGTTSVGQTANGTLQDCIASCSSTYGCTGATYNAKKVCMLRGGDGSSVISKTDDYALVPKSVQLLQIVKSLNDELTGVNTQIQNKTGEFYKFYGEQTDQRDNKNFDLIGQHQELQTERAQIEKMLNDYQNIEHQEGQAGLFVTQNYYVYFILFAIVVVAFIVLAFSAVDENTKNAVNFSVVQPSFSFAQVLSSYLLSVYTMFGIIVLIVFIYLYNQYSYSIYHNLPSFKKLGQMGALYLVFAVVVIYIAYSYFIKNGLRFY